MAAQSYLFVVFLVIAAVVADETDNIFEESSVTLPGCMVESGTKTDDLRAFVHHQPYPHTVKCLIKCMLVTSHVMTEEGGIFDIARIVHFVGEHRMEAINKCVGAVALTDICDRAWEYGACFRDEHTDFVRAAVNRVLDHVEANS